MKKRIVSLLLVFCMVITLVPANVLADEVKGLAETTAGQTQTAGTTAAKPENPFADVKSGSWYEAAVLYARANGFFDGTSATTFEPDGPMTRAMFVTVLGRMAGVEAADYAGATDFIDVAEGTWYAPFVKWAARYGITTGTGNGAFNPNGEITREEMAVFFVRYFETFDAMPKADTTVTTKPADLDEVSSWAQDAVGKLWALGLLNGDGVNFAPRDKATRALVQPYVDKLCAELTAIRETADRCGLHIRTFYIGGGTPTSLSAAQLEQLMSHIAKTFDLAKLDEYTVEAGRPDCTDAEKLRIIKKYGATRISINPQTFSDQVLQNIGRRHTAQDIIDCFAAARAAGHKNINMDLIAGLPGDTVEGFEASLRQAIALDPENITVHTLTRTICTARRARCKIWKTSAGPSPVSSASTIFI